VKVVKENQGNAEAAVEWAEWSRDWRGHLGTHTAAQTVTTYLRGVRQFTDHLAAHHPGTTPETVTRRHVEGFLTELARTGKAAATRRVRLMTLKSFFGWMLAEPATTLTVDPTVGVRAPDVPMPPVRVVTDDDLRAVLATCTRGDFTDLRDAAMLRILISCGLRRAEVVTLDIDDVDLTRGDLLVHGKGNKPRFVSLAGNKVSLAISRYLRVRRKHPGASSPAVFLSTRANTDGYRMRGQSLAEMVKRRCVLAGIDVFGPHALRHAWADANKRAGLSDEDLERMAGWSSPLMVRRYGRALADSRAREAHSKLGTRDRV